jgi:hypothetical protein
MTSPWYQHRRSLQLLTLSSRTMTSKPRPAPPRRLLLLPLSTLVVATTTTTTTPPASPRGGGRGRGKGERVSQQGRRQRSCWQRNSSLPPKCNGQKATTRYRYYRYWRTRTRRPRVTTRSTPRRGVPKQRHHHHHHHTARRPRRLNRSFSVPLPTPTAPSMSLPKQTALLKLSSAVRVRDAGVVAL